MKAPLPRASARFTRVAWSSLETRTWSIRIPCAESSGLKSLIDGVSWGAPLLCPG